jgi:hypothetical protein
MGAIMPGSRKSDIKASEIVTLMALAIFVVVIVAMVAALAWPKIKANWFTPTPVPGISQVFPVRQQVDCNGFLPIVVTGPTTISYVTSAFVDMEQAGAILEQPTDLEGWSAYWVYDHSEARLEYWLYGAGDSDGLVYELVPRCFWVDEEGFPWAEFAEVTVRQIEVDN